MCVSAYHSNHSRNNSTTLSHPTPLALPLPNPLPLPRLPLCPAPARLLLPAVSFFLSASRSSPRSHPAPAPAPSLAPPCSPLNQMISSSPHPLSPNLFSPSLPPLRIPRGRVSSSEIGIAAFSLEEKFMQVSPKGTSFIILFVMKSCTLALTIPNGIIFALTIPDDIIYSCSYYS